MIAAPVFITLTFSKAKSGTIKTFELAPCRIIRMTEYRKESGEFFTTKLTVENEPYPIEVEETTGEIKQKIYTAYSRA